MDPVEYLMDESRRTTATMRVLAQVFDERKRQDEKWGVQHHPDGTSYRGWSNRALSAQEDNDQNIIRQRSNWLDILKEEVYEAFAETDPQKLRAELVQVAAVACVWIEDIDSRSEG